MKSKNDLQTSGNVCVGASDRVGESIVDDAGRTVEIAAYGGSNRELESRHGFAIEMSRSLPADA